MVQYSFPTTIISGQGALKEFTERLKKKNHKKALIVTDEKLVEMGLVKELTHLLSSLKISYEVFDEVHPNPDETDVDNGVGAYNTAGCDSLIALGGGSPIDAAKAIKIMASNPPPLSRYDDTLGGDRLIKEPMPSLYAIPTTAGTGSEVGRSCVIIIKETGKKTVFFHPDLVPDIAILDPELTVALPREITAATGIDAFSHCLEAYFSIGFHPMADGIALQGIELILEWLPKACLNGKNIKARERMQIAAAMGATAFQKGLGMIHSMAHPLSSSYGMHHGLANALLLPDSVDYLEKSSLNREQRRRISKVIAFFAERNFNRETLAENCRDFFISLGIVFGLSKQTIPESDLERLSREAFQDSCHSCNMITVTQKDLLNVYYSAY